MTYQELKNFIDTLSKEDLEQPAKVYSDGLYHEIEFVNEESDIDGYAVLVAKLGCINIDSVDNKDEKPNKFSFYMGQWALKQITY